jgi:adenosylhomocysteinase
MRARGMGAHVIVTEVDPLHALEALMDGFEVLSTDKAAEVGDIFCTATGDKHVLARRHFERMKDGAILANTGHFNVEIEIPALQDMATETRVARPFVEEFMLGDGRRIYLVADGRLVNLGAAEGHPASVMDMSFANQALSAEFVAEGVQRARGDRSGDRPSQAGGGRGRDRHAHRGAGEVPGFLGRGHLVSAR